MHTIYHFQYKKKITLNYPKSTAQVFFSLGLKNEFETAVVNEPSVFEPLKFYCIFHNETLPNKEVLTRDALAQKKIRYDDILYLS